MSEHCEYTPAFPEVVHWYLPENWDDDGDEVPVGADGLLFVTGEDRATPGWDRTWTYFLETDRAFIEYRKD